MAFNMKKYKILEAIQLLFIAMKFTHLEYFSWPSTLIYFRISSIYMICFGAVLFIIFAVSFLGRSSTPL